MHKTSSLPQNHTTPATMPTVKPSMLLARCRVAIFARSTNDPSPDPLPPVA